MASKTNQRLAHLSDGTAKFAAGILLPSEVKELTNQPEPKAVPAKHGQEFIDLFGDLGARWLLEGRSFASCAIEFIKRKNETIADLEAQVRARTEQLAAMPK